jgi:hypothetical protein
MKAKYRMGSKSGATHALTSLMCIVLVAYFYYNTRTLSQTYSYAEFKDKMQLVDSVLAGRVFETSVSQVAVLSKLFKEYEKMQKYFIRGLNMTDWDGGCDHLYEDIVSGDFDRAWYSEKEYEYKMLYRNYTDVKIWNCDQQSEYGCCSSCKDVEDCCSCKYSDKFIEEVLEPNKHVPMRVTSQITYGFNMMRAQEKEKLTDLYEGVIKKLGYQGTGKKLYAYSFCKNWQYLAPGGFLMWHTNRYDNNKTPYRIYIMSVDQDGESAFKYKLPNGENHEVKDFHGAVRLFKNTFNDPKTGEEKFLWHSVYSNTHRHSLGFEIRPNEIVALLDRCDTCWDDLKQQYEDIYKKPFSKF